MTLSLRERGPPPYSLRTVSVTPDLLIVATARADFFALVHQFPDAASIEVRVDRRREERRRSTEPAAAGDERRRRDRRSRDINDQLRTVGWAFVPAGERNT